MTLPTEKTKPKTNLWEYPIFLYGDKMIGKSTLANEIEGNLFFNTAGGLDALEHFEVKINSWQDFLEAGAEFISGKHMFKVATIDTIDRLHKLCAEHIMKLKNITHPQDLEFGKGYDMIKDEFIRPLTKLALSKYGLIMISHVKDVEITSRTRKFNKNIPTLQSYVWELINALSGIVMFYTTEEGLDKEGKSIRKRIIRTSPDEKWIAGDRTKKLLSFGDIEMTADGGNWKKIEDIFNRNMKGETK